jgi:hypothetical protein
MGKAPPKLEERRRKRATITTTMWREMVGTAQARLCPAYAVITLICGVKI